MCMRSCVRSVADDFPCWTLERLPLRGSSAGSTAWSHRTARFRLRFPRVDQPLRCLSKRLSSSVANRSSPRSRTWIGTRVVDLKCNSIKKFGLETTVGTRSKTGGERVEITNWYRQPAAPRVHSNWSPRHPKAASKLRAVQKQHDQQRSRCEQGDRRNPG